MISVHVISDLDLKFNEFTPKTEETIPDVDLVILNGNIAYQPKRGMLYAETLCNKYPRTHFVYNFGFHELYTKGGFFKSRDELVSSVKSRANFNSNWPQNLHFFPEDYKRLTLRNGHKVDIFCAFGYPQIYSYKGSWEDHIWYKNIMVDMTQDIEDPRLVLPKDTSRVNHGHWPVWATKEWINEQNQIEFNKIKSWELNYDENSGFKILVTHINPVRDSRYENMSVDFFNMHLDKGMWIGSNTKVENTMYLGAKFISNPGRGEQARSLVIHAERK